jgi:hypothetical protein
MLRQIKSTYLVESARIAPIAARITPVDEKYYHRSLMKTDEEIYTYSVLGTMGVFFNSKGGDYTTILDHPESQGAILGGIEIDHRGDYYIAMLWVKGDELEFEYTTHDLVPQTGLVIHPMHAAAKPLLPSLVVPRFTTQVLLPVAEQIQEALKHHDVAWNPKEPLPMETLTAMHQKLRELK